MKLIILFFVLVVLASAVALLKKTYFPNPSMAVEVAFGVAETILVLVIFVSYLRKNGFNAK